ncbi:MULTISPECIES: hypothetical protein [Shouchella]|uniref:Uncharacterized protein n=5 Tax=Bacillaceae TaxID=186817 RepID=A0A060M8G5_9BACI|nr:MULTISPECIES: hypothetical protein [Bacillaceae]RQW18974.1 hypothetical protein EH196_18670 [Bacillus sp. C1-1]AIC96379.1 hypothetical protein BleG1_3832 [Shouchella lehensis G1]KQL57410.1 hypothetical protein AN965_07840 [Alkalicoccobacillus plakortidis]MBG9785248.1 hypothetical protein [Shouchella lehensis]MED4127708.1 hypothetical protein [Shouchella miscanthi]
MFSAKSVLVETDSSKSVSEVEVRFVASNFSGQASITDAMLQGGTTSTNWTGHPSEHRWSNE